MKKYFILLLSIFFLSIAVPVFSISSASAASTGKAASKIEKAPVTLAYSWNWKTDVSGWWMSEKLDGVRGYWTGKKLISRSGKTFNAPSWFTKNFPPFPLDGELWMGRGSFAELSGVTRKKKPDARWEKVGYFIFDSPLDGEEFEKRLDLARNWFKEHPNTRVKIIEQEVCKNNKHLLKKLAEIEAQGGEGLILRKPKSKHVVGRSRNFLKVKRFKENTAKVIKHFPGTGKHAGRLGSLLAELENGMRFSIGTGFSNKERENPPSVGSMIIFKYQGFTKSGIPRFASFLRVKKTPSEAKNKSKQIGGK